MEYKFWQDVESKDAYEVSIDYWYQFEVIKRPTGWALIWLRIRYFFPDLWFTVKWKLGIGDDE